MELVGRGGAGSTVRIVLCGLLASLTPWAGNAQVEDALVAAVPHDTIPVWTVDTLLILDSFRMQEGELSWVGEILSRGDLVFLSQPSRREVWLFDSAGSRQSVIGRKEPVQFRSVATMGWKGDSLWITDPRSGTIELFVAERYVRSVRLRRAGFQVAAILEDGSLLGTGNVSSAAVRRGQGVDLPLQRLSEEGVVQGSVGEIRLQNLSSIVRMGDSQLHTRQPFSNSDLWDVSSNGRHWVIVGFSDQALSITVSSLQDGRTTISIPFERKPLGTSRVDSVLDSLVRVASSREWFTPAYRELLRQELYIPEFCRPATDVLVTNNGRIWIRREDCDARENVWWDIFDPSLQQIGRVALPADLSVLDAGNGEVWGRLQVEDRVEIRRLQVRNNERAGA